MTVDDDDDDDDDDDNVFAMRVGRTCLQNLVID